MGRGGCVRARPPQKRLLGPRALDLGTTLEARAGAALVGVAGARCGGDIARDISRGPRASLPERSWALHHGGHGKEGVPRI